MVNLICEPYLKVAGAGASCDHQKSKLLGVLVEDSFWVVELRVWQVKIGRKSCFAFYIHSIFFALLLSFSKI